MIEFARSHCRRAHLAFEVGDARELPYSDEFDLRPSTPTTRSTAELLAGPARSSSIQMEVECRRRESLTC
jgi:hypothetical protein